nr:hypothetical protein CFP56_04314 [Quercus suber]
MPKASNPLRRTSSASPFASLQRRKSSSSRVAKSDASERLDDTGLTPSLASANTPQDVVSLMKYIQDGAFDEIPHKAAGMGSERISETLRFRRALPPIVSIAHLLALSRSATVTERELARLIAEGKVRKVTIPGRGRGGTAVGEGVVLASDWEGWVLDDSKLDEEIKQKFIALMRAQPISPTVATISLSPDEVRALVTAGFLTTPTALSSSVSTSSLLAPLHSSSSPSSISKAGSSAATGTLAAIGGVGAIHESGASGSVLSGRGQYTRPSTLAQTMTFSLPRTGAYLALLTQSRVHLLALLKLLSPRYKEATQEVLREKWDGNVLGDRTSQQKRARGEWSGVLPGKTKRWREFYGLTFDFVLAECVGSGLVEIFDTGSVGMGVRGR